MKISPRIAIPILAACAVAGGMLTLVWWQLSISSDQLKKQLQTTAQVSAISVTSVANDSTDLGDEVLLHLRQGDLDALQGDWPASEKEYMQSVNQGGGIPALRKLAEAQIQRREMDGAQKTISQLRQLGAKDGDLLLLQVSILLRTGEVVKARALLDGGADSPQKQYGLALIGIIQGDNENAQKNLQAVIAGWDPALRTYARTLQAAYDEYALFPQSATIHLTTLLSRALAQVQECDLALPLLGQVVTQQDNYRDAWIVQGYCQLTTERMQDALASFERAYALDPEKPEIQYFLGRAYLSLKDSKNAITFLQYALQNGFQPETEVRKQLAAAALGAGDPSLAFDQYKSMSHLTDADIGVYQQAVTLGIALGRTQDAYDLAGNAITKWPNSARAYDLAGWSAQELHRKDQARAALEKALQLDPTLQSAKDHLGKL